MFCGSRKLYLLVVPYTPPYLKQCSSRMYNKWLAFEITSETVKTCFWGQCLGFNPIALRMAKTQWSFGHSECNRVKSQTLSSVSPPLLLLSWGYALLQSTINPTFRPLLRLSKRAFEYHAWDLTLLHSEWPKLNGVLAILSAIGLKDHFWLVQKRILIRMTTGEEKEENDLDLRNKVLNSGVDLSLGGLNNRLNSSHLPNHFHSCSMSVLPEFLWPLKSSFVEFLQVWHLLWTHAENIGMLCKQQGLTLSKTEMICIEQSQLTFHSAVVSCMKMYENNDLLFFLFNLSNWGYTAFQQWSP